MKRTGVLAASAALSICAPQALAAPVVDIDGIANASVDGANALNVVLAAGTYHMGFVQGIYTAFNRFGGVSGCDSSGANCTTGWENSVAIIVNGLDQLAFGDGDANGGPGPLDPGDGYHGSAATSLARASVYDTTFTLPATTTLSFYIRDDLNTDNLGGVSLRISEVGAVPEPSTWAVMLLGFGAIGFALRRRRPAVRYSFA